MSEKKSDAAVSKQLLQKGYVPANTPLKVQGGYQGPTSGGGGAPSGGTSVKPPSTAKK